MTLPLARKRIRISAGEMAYVDMGEGRPVILLHGFPTSAHLWRREAWLLAQRMRVIVPDLVGYGESDQLSDAELSELAQAGYVGELLAALGIDEVAVVGHDVGGAIAQTLALEGHPTVRALVLLDSVCFEAWPTEAVRIAQAVRPEDETAASADEIVRATFALGVAHRDRLAEEDVAAYLRPWQRDPAALFRAARGLTGKGVSGREAELGDPDLPALIIWGEADPFLRSELAERLGEAIPGSTVALLPGCSHFVNEDAPQVVGPLISEYLRARYLNERHDHGGEPVTVLLERPPAGFR
ncbi:MAG TPA: alpha/beta fold hydrolase [Actinomycetota bacterium]